MAELTDEAPDDVLDSLLAQHVKELRGSFDTVQIFATKYRGNDATTFSASRGEGNYFARYGQLKQWIRAEEDALTSNDEEEI